MGVCINNFKQILESISRKTSKMAFRSIRANPICGNNDKNRATEGLET
jgi:hypothetical protein